MSNRTEITVQGGRLCLISALMDEGGDGADAYNINVPHVDVFFIFMTYFLTVTCYRSSGKYFI